jgi:catalase
VNAFVFIKGGRTTTLRYRIIPIAGEQHFDATALETKSPTYLFDELSQRIHSTPIEFKLVAQVAEDGDMTDDATEIWPEERGIVELGILRIEKALTEEESLLQQKKIIFDPIPRVDGVQASDDPLLEVRANVYLKSGQQRRAAQVGAASKTDTGEAVKVVT